MKIKAQKRDIAGKKVQNLREQGLVPASVYGPKRESTNIVVDHKEFLKVYRDAGSNILIDLELDGGKTTQVLVQEVQEEPLQDKYIHVSFYEVDPTKKITTRVPVILEGVSPAVKNNIGFLVTEMDEIEVVCLPKDIPQTIMVDISALAEIGDNVSLEDVDLPQGVELPSTVDVNTSVVLIAPPQKEIVEEEPETEEVEGEEGEEGEESEEQVEGEKEEPLEEGEKTEK